MTVTFRPAKDKNDPSFVMAGIAGYSGTGKTFSALRLARGLAGDKPFALIDTESGRALHYRHVCPPWDHADLEPPYTPEAYIAAIKEAAAAGYGVIVVDSASHEYSGPGGLMDAAEAELDRMAGSDMAKRAKLTASAWNKPKRRHVQMVEELLRVKAHIVLCFRAREAIEMRKNPQTGKVEVVPVQSIPGHPGWLIETEHRRMPLPYELTVSFLLIPRPEGERGLPIPVKLEDQHKPFVPLDRPISEETGSALAKWAAGDSAKPSTKTATTPTASPSVDPTDPSVAALTSGLLELAEKIGREDFFAAEIAKNRRTATTEQHVVWLQRQITRVTDALEQQGITA